MILYSIVFSFFFITWQIYAFLNKDTEVVENFHQFNRQEHTIAIPKVFTKKGLCMLATILKSPKAVEKTIVFLYFCHR